MNPFQIAPARGPLGFAWIAVISASFCGFHSFNDSLGATASPAPSGTPAVQPKERSSTQAKDRVFWDSWYTVTIGENPSHPLHYEYYNDRATMKKGRLYYLNHAWKKEEDFINEEQLGAFAVPDEDITPLFYNFHSSYRSTETAIDATVQSDGTLVVKVRKGNEEMPIVKRELPKKVFFSTFFPLWLATHLENMKTGVTSTFETLLEDNIDSGFSPVSGQYRLEPPDAFAQKTKTSKITVNLGQTAYWWVEKSGEPVRIELPEHATVIERVSKEKASSFLAK